MITVKFVSLFFSLSLVPVSRSYKCIKIIVSVV